MDKEVTVRLMFNRETTKAESLNKR